MTYGGVHRFLLRTIASRGVMTVVETEHVVNSFADNGEINIYIHTHYSRLICRFFCQNAKVVKITNRFIVY